MTIVLHASHGAKGGIMLNDETIIHPRLQHIGLTTGNLERLADWYHQVLGTRLIYLSENPIGAPEGGFKVRAGWFSNDAANHRIAVVEIPGLDFDKDRSRHTRLQHIAFEYRTLDALLGTYARLKTLGIVPVLAVNEGAQTAFYYDDPDRNNIELNVSNFGDYGDNWSSIEHMQTSPDFARKPLGVDVDPDKLIEARNAGASPWEIHKRAWKNEFAPAEPYNPLVLL
jgi:catechol 2,3-dioxygenase